LPDVIRQLVQLQQQSVTAITARLRKLETQEPATRIYIQSIDPGAVGGGSIWIDTASGVIAYRSGDDTSWLPVATVSAAVHSLTGVSHTVAGLTTGHLLTALSAVTFGFALDPVVDLANALGDLIVATAADTLTILPRGVDGDVLYTDSGEATGLKWGVLPPQTTIVNDPDWAALGDLAAGTGANTAIILPRGVNGDVLYTDSGAASGLRWDVLPASAPHAVLSASHSDTTVSAPNAADVLTWDAGTSKWVAAAVPAQTTVADDPIWDAAGDIVAATGPNAASKIVIGGAGDVLTVVAGVPAWQAPAAGGSVATDVIWDAAGDLVVGTGPDAASKLTIGSAGEVLTVVGGTASWQAPAGGAGADPTLAIMNLLGWA
jgi:hypothetical protein